MEGKPKVKIIAGAKFIHVDSPNDGRPEPSCMWCDFSGGEDTCNLARINLRLRSECGLIANTYKIWKIVKPII